MIATLLRDHRRRLFLARAMADLVHRSAHRAAVTPPPGAHPGSTWTRADPNASAFTTTAPVTSSPTHDHFSDRLSVSFSRHCFRRFPLMWNDHRTAQVAVRSTLVGTGSIPYAQVCRCAQAAK